MKQYYTPDGIVDIELSDRELYDEMLTGEVYNLQKLDEDTVYEAYEQLFACEHIYFMRHEDDAAMSYPVGTFEYPTSEFLKSACLPGIFNGLIAIVRGIDIGSENILVKVVTLRPDNEDFQRVLKIADRKKTITEFLLHNE